MILLLKVLFWVNILFKVIFWGLFWVGLLFWGLFWVTFLLQTLFWVNLLKKLLKKVLKKVLKERSPQKSTQKSPFILLFWIQNLYHGVCRTIKYETKNYHLSLFVVSFKIIEFIVLGSWCDWGSLQDFIYTYYTKKKKMKAKLFLEAIIHNRALRYYYYRY